jgi:selenocysteine lyase/cysteine desulfurase
MTEENAARILSSYRTPATRAVVALHASNICSRTLPLKAIGAYCRQNGLLFIADAAQSIGHLPIDLEEMGITALCAPGHKGLMGPQGSGFLALSADLSEESLPLPLLEGGSGYDSFLPTMPLSAPERYEAGTVATPCIAGLLAGILGKGKVYDGKDLRDARRAYKNGRRVEVRRNFGIRSG